MSEHDQPRPARRPRTTTERITELRDVVQKNFERYQQKELRLAHELATVRAARVAAEAELQRISSLVQPTAAERTLPLPHSEPNGQAAAAPPQDGPP